jgi:hypothetical protein
MSQHCQPSPPHLPHHVPLPDALHAFHKAKAVPHRAAGGVAIPAVNSAGGAHGLPGQRQGKGWEGERGAVAKWNCTAGCDYQQRDTLLLKAAEEMSGCGDS